MKRRKINIRPSRLEILNVDGKPVLRFHEYRIETDTKIIIDIHLGGEYWLSYLATHCKKWLALRIQDMQSIYEDIRS